MTEAGLSATASHLRAIHWLTEVAARASAAEEIHDEAINVLTGTLGADRASVLLFDEAGVMRFTAWRGLSDGYRMAADGHSPWSVDAQDPQPVLVPDVTADPNLAALLDTILGEGIRALAFIPLVSGGRLLGKFMLYFDEVHDFTDDEVELAETVASHVAFAIDRRRLETDLRLANAALAATLDAVPDGITVQAPGGGLLFANDDAAAMVGYASPGELMAAGSQAIMERFEVFDEHGEPLALWDLPGRRALLGDQPPDMLIRYRLTDTGEERWSLVSARPVLADDRSVRFAVNVFRDVTERQQAVQALRFLATTSRRLLDSTLDYATVLQRVAELFVPAMADVCIVRELREDGSVQRIAASHSGKVDADRFLGLQDEPDPLQGTALLARVTRGESVVIDDVAGSPFGTAATTLGLDSALVAPLISGARTVGIVSMATVEGGRRYRQDDVSLVEQVARRAALAVENARLFADRSTVASTLQRALLPPELPEIPGMELAARYHAAVSDIGGDFYDVMQTGPSRWVISVGDVCGKGIEAASFTAMVRYTLRAFAPTAARPSQLLASVNDALLRQLGPERFCTLACGILETTGDGTRLTLALGGHPRPLLVSPSGAVRPVGVPGSLLGSLPEPDLVDDEVFFGPGDALVLFTDGCVGDLPADEERLVTVLRRSAGCDAGTIAEAVEAAAHTVAAHVDDLTVLACRRVGGGAQASV